MFANARKLAPCLILLENIDILLGNLSNLSDEGVDEKRKMRSRTSDNTIDRFLSAFLIEIDGILSTSREDTGTIDPVNFDLREQALKPVIVIATSYNIECIDSSLLRPGRLEEHIYLTLPSDSDRRRLVEFYLSSTSLLGVERASVGYEKLIDEIVGRTINW